MTISRRRLLAAAPFAASVSVSPRIVLAQTPAQAIAGPVKLEALPYATNALEPYIDAQTMEIHHDRHHAAYVTNLNTVFREYPQLAQIPAQGLLAQLAELSDSIRPTVRNNLGGHVNHAFFWESMSPNGGKPAGALAHAIDRDFGSLANFQNDFNAAGLRVFGSGWTFLTVSGGGKLQIETRPNQDTPLTDGRQPLLNLDVWEHAYYLKYQNKRADYIRAWWNVVNWNKLAERYSAYKD
jgi:Fe-Mn family superoxide dismutase